MALPPPEGQLPSHLGPYAVERQLGAGAMGVVFLARDERLGRKVALKLLPAAFAEDLERLARFEREARLLAALHHQNVASLFGLEATDGQHFLVMEYVEGETLAARIARGPMELDDVLDVGEQIGRGLAAAHDRGIVHRDLKPGNVLVTPQGRAKIVDFGLAKDLASTHSGAGSDSRGSTPKITGESGTVASDPPILEGPTILVSGSSEAAPPRLLATEAGAILGTAAYMSPEQARGRPVDRRCDVWAFGCVLFEIALRQSALPGSDLRGS